MAQENRRIIGPACKGCQLQARVLQLLRKGGAELDALLTMVLYFLPCVHGTLVATELGRAP